jgi:hypothetical protein
MTTRKVRPSPGVPQRLANQPFLPFSRSTRQFNIFPSYASSSLATANQYFAYPLSSTGPLHWQVVSIRSSRRQSNIDVSAFHLLDFCAWAEGSVRCGFFSTRLSHFHRDSTETNWWYIVPANCCQMHFLSTPKTTQERRTRLVSSLSRSTH